MEKLKVNKKSQIIKNILKILIIVIITITLIRIICIITSPNNKEIEKTYNKSKENYELLLKMKYEIINDGEGIDAEKFPKDEFEYELITNQDYILLKYNLKHTPEIYAEIKLTKDYKVINEIYNPKVDETFKEYKVSYIKKNIFIDFLGCGVLCSFIFLIICSIKTTKI